MQCVGESASLLESLASEEGSDEESSEADFPALLEHCCASEYPQGSAHDELSAPCGLNDQESETRALFRSRSNSTDIGFMLPTAEEVRGELASPSMSADADQSRGDTGVKITSPGACGRIDSDQGSKDGGTKVTSSGVSVQASTTCPNYCIIVRRSDD